MGESSEEPEWVADGSIYKLQQCDARLYLRTESVDIDVDEMSIAPNPKPLVERAGLG